MTWRTHTISALDSPLVDPARIAEARALYGEDSPEWASEILGVTAARQRTTLIAMSDYHGALRRSPLFTGDRGTETVLPYEHPAPEDFERVRRQRAGEPAEQFRNVIALDPSAGGDLCLAARRKGSALVELAELDGRSEDAMAHGIIAMMREDLADEILIERGGGYGRGAAEILRREYRNVVRWWDPSASPREKTCGNARSEAWLHFAHLLAAGQVSLVADPGGRLEAALAAVSRRSGENGKQYITDRETLVAELGFSPDHASAVVICFHGFAFGRGSAVQSVRFAI